MKIQYPSEVLSFFMTEKRSSLGEALGLAWGLGYRIAVPIVIFGLLGRFLDTKLGTSFVFLLVGIFFALGISSYLIYRELKEILKEENDGGKGV